MFILPSNLKLIRIFLLFLISIYIAGCTRSDKPAKFRIYFRTNDADKEQIAMISDLSKGSFNPAQSRVILDSDIYYDWYYYKGVYYDIDRVDKIKKYTLKGDQPVFQDSCVLKHMTEIETHSFIDDSTLLIVGLDNKHRNPVYALIDTHSFTVRDEGDIAIPDDGSYQRTSIGFAMKMNNKVYVTYVYHHLLEHSYTTYESINLITLDYPQMRVSNNSTNDSTTYQANNGRHQPTVAIGADNNFYLITNTSNAFGKMEHIPSGILRVNTKEESLDSSFFINTSTSLKNCYPMALWHVSGDIFLIKCERRDLIKGWSDYLDRRIFEYYSVNVATGKLTLLGLPLDAPWYTNNVIVDNGIAYIADNEEDGYTFWIFDPKAGSITQGLKLDASVTRILSIDLN